MEYNPRFVKQAQYLIWIQWVFFSLFGWAFGLFATWGAQVETITRFGWIAAFLGLGQWFVLRRYIRRPTWLWIGLTGLGMMAAQFLTQQLVRYLAVNEIVRLQGISTLGGAMMGGIIGIVIGICISLAQSILVRRNETALRDWIIVNVVGWGFGFQAGTLFGQLLLSADYRATSFVAVILQSIITGLWVTQRVRDA